MLPIEQIGSMLSTNQWAEELPHGQADDAGKNDPLIFSNSLLPEQYQLASNFSDSTSLLWIHLSATIPSNHSIDVVSPPPDFIA